MCDDWADRFERDFETDDLDHIVNMTLTPPRSSS
jgi:hypothetical protein